MQNGFELIVPSIVPPLDPDFKPAVLANHSFLNQVRASKHAQSLVFALELTERSYFKIRNPRLLTPSTSISNQFLLR